MADKINPPTKTVGKSDGVPTSHVTMETPKFEGSNMNTNWAKDNKQSIFKK